MTTLSKIITALCLVFVLASPSFGELSEAGSAYCNTTQVTVSYDGLPLGGRSGYETYMKLYLVPEPALLGLLLLALTLSLRNHQPLGKL